MFRFKTARAIAQGARQRMPWKLIAAVAFVVCSFAAFAIGIAWATPPQGFTSTPLVGPAVMDEVHSVHETRDFGVLIQTRGLSDIYVTHLRIVPGGHGGWHSHPGPSIIAVRSGTATFYDECNDFIPQDYPAGTGFVEDAGCVHILTNEGNVDLEVVVMQIVPRGAPRRIDEPAPF